MRRRDHSLRTGNLLFSLSEETPRKNAGILFLVSGTADIATLSRIEAATRTLVERGCRWHTVADHADLTQIHSEVNKANLFIVEAAEFRGLGRKQLETVLHQAGEDLLQHRCPRFPNAGTAVGGVARGLNFLDREDVTKDLLKALNDGTDILLTGPRRSGKTSLLRHIEDLLGDERTLFCDLEKEVSAHGMVTRLHADMHGLSHREARTHTQKNGWEATLQQVVTDLKARSSAAPVLILDELQYFLDNILRGDDPPKPGRETCVHVLRTIGETCRSQGVRILVSGSGDLEGFLERRLGRKLDSMPGPIAQLRRFPLPPLSEKSLKIELHRVMIGTGIIPESRDIAWIKDHLDLGMPFPALRFLNHLDSRLREVPNLSREELTFELDRFLKESDAFNELDRHLTMKEEIDLDDFEEIAESLTRLARLGAGTPSMPVPGDLSANGRAWMQDKLPVRFDEDGMRFASALFNRWWRNREGLDT